MSTETTRLETRVGIFVFLGLLAIAIMAVQFGRLGQGLSKVYELTLIFDNASGLLKNSDVQLAGAVVGRVLAKPATTPGRFGTVTVKVAIQESIKIPRGCTFEIGSSGLLGDRFVAISLPEGFDYKTYNPNDPKEAIQPGETIEGTKPPPGMDALTRKGDEAMEKLNANLDELKISLTKLQSNLLSDENLTNVRDSFVSIRTTGENFVAASEKINDVLVRAEGAVNEAKETIASAKQTMTTANLAAEDIRKAISDAREAIGKAEQVLKTAQSGPGTVPMLLNNRQVAENLAALISNIRRHGVLFYKDSAPREEQPRPPRRAEPSQRRR